MVVTGYELAKGIEEKLKNIQYIPISIYDIKSSIDKLNTTISNLIKGKLNEFIKEREFEKVGIRVHVISCFPREFRYNQTLGRIKLYGSCIIKVDREKTIN